MKKLKLTIAFVLMIYFALAVSSAAAHKPVWGKPGVDTQIPDIVTSYGWYREVSADAPPDIFTFEAEEGQHLHAGISVPRISGLEDFQVNMVLLGPGLPPIYARDLPEGTLLPQDQNFGPICEGTGMGIVAPAASEGEFFEPFTQTRYLKRQTLEADLPETGVYYLVINSVGHSPGKYVLDTGQEESFGPGDLLRFPVWWVKVHLYFGHLPWLVGSLAVLAGLVTGGILLRRNSRRQKTADRS